VAGLVTAAVGVVLIGGGVYFGLQAQKKQDEIESLSTQEPSPDGWDAGLKKDGERAELTMFVLTGVGVAAIGTGAILYYLGHRAADSVSVSVGPGRASVGVGVHF
jgi:hypothetical protein